MGNLRAALSVRKWPGYAISLLGVAWQFLDIGGRLELLWRIVEGMGGTPAAIAAAILWPWTGVLLIAVGLCYSLFVGEPPKGVQRHHWWPYVGWATFALAFVSMAGTAIYGAAEFYIRTEIAKGLAGVPRGAPDENSPGRAQRPLTVKSRQLQPDQIRLLLQEMPKLRDVMTRVTVALTANDGEALNVFQTYQMIFTRSGLPVRMASFSPRDPEDQGLLILICDTKHIPDDAERFRETLALPNINTTYSNIGPKITYLPGPVPDFVFFIAPAPLN